MNIDIDLYQYSRQLTSNQKTTGHSSQWQALPLNLTTALKFSKFALPQWFKAKPTLSSCDCTRNPNDNWQNHTKKRQNPFARNCSSYAARFFTFKEREMEKTANAPFYKSLLTLSAALFETMNESARARYPATRKG